MNLTRLGFTCLATCLRSRKDAFNPTSMEDVMSKIRRSIAALVAASVLSLVGLMIGDHKLQAVENVNSVRVADIQKTLRDLLAGAHFLGSACRVVQHDDRSSRAGCRREAGSGQRQSNCEHSCAFLWRSGLSEVLCPANSHAAAVKDYSEATTFGNTRAQKTALSGLASNADLFAEFMNEANPQHLPKDTVRDMIAAHGAHHVLQINQYMKKEYVHLDETWPMMRQHVYLFADTLTTGLVKQFPSRFS